MQVLSAVIIFLSVFSIAFCVEILNHYSLSAPKNVSVLRPAWERAFSRKRRFLLFPKGGTLKFTVFLSKGFLALYPTGFNFIIEAAFYYPGPWQRIDLIPKHLRPTTTPVPKPAGPVEPIVVCIPGSLICYRGKPAIKPAKVQRIDEDVNELYLTDSSYKYVQPTYTNKWNKYNKYANSTAYEQKYAWNPTRPKWQYKPKPQPNWQKWTTPMPEKSTWTRWRTSENYVKRWHRAAEEEILPELMEVVPTTFPDLEPHANWKHYGTHRDRRQLYHNFEGFSKILGFDMRICILRTICDAKEFLLPKGYSLIHDILRVLFTFPTRSGMADDYSRVMQADYETCDKELQSKCPINLLNWFTNTSMSGTI